MAAIVCGVFLYGMIGIVVTGDLELSRFLNFLTFYLPAFAAILAVNIWLTPFAVAGLVASEYFRVKRWWPYPIGGAALGLIICAQGLPYSYDASFENMLPYYSCVMAGSTFAGFVYWLISWRKWPPGWSETRVQEFAS